jgi:ABC-type transporter Mla subunit MlaD
MPLQDLTPELRTRLRRVERTVGWFVTLAAVILFVGFAYYIYATAKARGWFVTKLNYATGLDSAAGLSAGDPVTLMGFSVGEITEIKPNDPAKAHGVTIFFRIKDPYWGYIWYDSRVLVNSDFLGHRFLEVVKGQNGQPSAFTGPDGKLMVMNSMLTYDKYKELKAQLTSLSTNQGLPEDAILAQVTNQLMEIIKSQKDVYYTNAIHARYIPRAGTTIGFRHSKSLPCPTGWRPSPPQCNWRCRAF